MLFIWKKRRPIGVKSRRWRPRAVVGMNCWRDSNQPTASHPPIDVKFQQRWPKSSPIHDFRFSGARKSLVPTQIPWISSVKAWECFLEVTEASGLNSKTKKAKYEWMSFKSRLFSSNSVGHKMRLSLDQEIQARKGNKTTSKNIDWCTNQTRKAVTQRQDLFRDIKQVQPIATPNTANKSQETFKKKDDLKPSVSKCYFAILLKSKIFCQRNAHGHGLFNTFIFSRQKT